MQAIPQEQIDKRFQALPETLQDAIFSEAITDAIRRICVLREAENKTPTVALLVGHVLLGYLRPENFAAEIQKEAGIDAMRAAHIAHDIDTEVFSGVRLELKKLYPPTIQTPTVQTQGFVSRTPEPPSAVRRPEPARPYVVPIPEKFRTKSMWHSHPAQPAETPAPAPMPTPVIPTMQTAHEKETAPIIAEKSTPVPQAPKIESTPLSDIKPIVPLPTFIQSKFKETLKQTTGEKQTTQENPALKSAITQFTTPHTAAKRAEPEQKESVYRESVTETERPHSGGVGEETQKAEGKVIDLSGL